MNKLLYMIFIIMNFVSSTDSKPPTLDRNLLFEAEKNKHLVEFKNLIKYFIDLEEPKKYLDQLKKHDMNILIKVDKSFENHYSAKMLRRLFRYNLVCMSTLISDIANQNSKFKSRIDELFNERMSKGFLESELYKQLKKSNKSENMDNLNSIAFTFDYFNNIMRRITNKFDKYIAVETSLLANHFFTLCSKGDFSELAEKSDKKSTPSTVDSFIKDKEDSFKNQFENFNMKILEVTHNEDLFRQTNNIFSAIENCRNIFSEILLKLKLVEKNIVNDYNIVTTGNVIISRFDLMKLLLNPKIQTVENTTNVLKNYIKAHLMFSFYKFPTSSSLDSFINQYDDDDESNNLLSDLINCIDMDIVWDTGDFQNITVLDNAIEKVCKQIETSKSNNSGFSLENIKQYFSPLPTINLDIILPYKKYEVFNTEKEFVESYFSTFEDSFDADPRYTSSKEMKEIGYKKQYYLSHYYIYLLKKIANTIVGSSIKKYSSQIYINNDSDKKLLYQFLELLDKITEYREFEAEDFLTKLMTLASMLSKSLSKNYYDSELDSKILKLKFCKLLTFNEDKVVDLDKFEKTLISKTKVDMFSYIKEFIQSYVFYIFWVNFTISALLLLVLISIGKTDNSFMN